MALGALATQSCEFTGKHYGYHERDHYDHDRYYHEGQFERKQLPLRPPVDRKRIFEQMPVSELAVMVHGCRQLPTPGRA